MAIIVDIYAFNGFLDFVLIYLPFLQHKRIGYQPHPLNHLRESLSLFISLSLLLYIPPAAIFLPLVSWSPYLSSFVHTIPNQRGRWRLETPTSYRASIGCDSRGEEESKRLVVKCPHPTPDMD